MKVVVLSGSPHKKGTTAALVSRFVEGAESAGHEVTRFDCAFLKIHPCLGCETCHTPDGSKCVYDDDMTMINEKLVEADCVVFATPVYYYGMCAQLKVVLDRFYAKNTPLHVYKKTMLITAMGADMSSADPVIVSYRGAVKYLGWDDVGMVNAHDCMTAESLQGTSFPEDAYQLGKNLK